MEIESKLNYLEGEDCKNKAKSINDIFDPTKGLMRIVSVDESENRAGVYACKMEETTTKNSYISIVIKYLDGRYSKTFKIRISDLKFTYENSKYLQKASIIKEMENYSLSEIGISYYQLFYILSKVHRKLPIRTFTKKFPIPQVYSMIMNKAISNSENNINDYSIKGGSYNLTLDEINEIAEEAGYTRDELMDEMVSYEILIKDSDTKRYQRTIRSKKLGVMKCYSFKSPETYKEWNNKSEGARDLPQEEKDNLKKGFEALSEHKFSKKVIKEWKDYKK